MRVLTLSQYFLKDNIMLLLGACLCLYFSYHALAGQRSVLTLMRLQVEISAMQQNLEQVRAERVALRDDVVRLRPDALDVDFLEELAVRDLGYQRANEISVLTPVL